MQPSQEEANHRAQPLQLVRGVPARRPSLALGSDVGADRCNGSAVRRCAAAPGPGDATPGPQPGPCFAGKPDPWADGLSRRAPRKGAPRPSAYRKTPATLPALRTSNNHPDRTGVVALWVSDQATTPEVSPAAPSGSQPGPGWLRSPVRSPVPVAPRRVRGRAHPTTGPPMNASDAAAVTDPQPSTPTVNPGRAAGSCAMGLRRQAQPQQGDATTPGRSPGVVTRTRLPDRAAGLRADGQTREAREST